MPRVRSMFAVLLLSLGLVACAGGGSTPSGPRGEAAVAGTPCQATGTRITHVVWILMENKSSSKVLGSNSAPYLNSLGQHCGVATNDHGVAHPSLPNYIALTSGSTQGVADDRSPSAHPIGAPSIFSQLDAAGRTWKSYEESMPDNCRRTNSGRYAVRHNPAAYYTGLRSCDTNDVPYGQLAGDLSSANLPAFSFITPNLCHDMHDCSVSAGDTWLSQELPVLLNSSTYRSGSTAVFITWDEDDDRSGNQIPLFVVAPAVHAGTLSSLAFQHPAMLDVTEQLLGLPALPGATGGTELRRAFQL